MPNQHSAVAELAVAGLSRRVAHALHALLVATNEQKAPPYTAEVAIYDAEAIDVHATAAALNHAERRGLAAAAGPSPVVWTPTPLCYELRPALEDRFLDETENPDA